MRPRDTTVPEIVTAVLPAARACPASNPVDKEAAVMSPQPMVYTAVGGGVGRPSMDESMTRPEAPRDKEVRKIVLPSTPGSRVVPAVVTPPFGAGRMG